MALEALGTLVNYDGTDLGSPEPFVYFFARFVQTQPAFTNMVRSISSACLAHDATTARRYGQEIAAGVVDQLLNLSTFVHACERPVRSPTGNDLLWMEFCLTGNSAPITGLIDQLERRDIVRERLQEWLSVKKPFLSGFLHKRRKRAKYRSIERKLGISLDSLTTDAQDLDCRAYMVDSTLSRERYLLATDILPFKLSDDEFNHVMIKCTAKWSVASQAAKHAIVFEVCEQQCSRRIERARLSLIDVLACAQAEIAASVLGGECISAHMH